MASRGMGIEHIGFMVGKFNVVTDTKSLRKPQGKKTPGRLLGRYVSGVVMMICVCLAVQQVAMVVVREAVTPPS